MVNTESSFWFYKDMCNWNMKHINQEQFEIVNA